VAEEGVAAGRSLKEVYDAALERMRPKYGHWVIFQHCMPFDVSRAYDEASGSTTPDLDAERDREMWAALERASAAPRLPRSGRPPSPARRP
jgi:hypothetical protein